MQNLMVNVLFMDVNMWFVLPLPPLILPLLIMIVKKIVKIGKNTVFSRFLNYIGICFAVIADASVLVTLLPKLLIFIVLAIIEFVIAAAILIFAMKILSTYDKDLRESEARLKDAQALGRIGSWEFDVHTDQITWSDQTFQLFERDPARGPPTSEEESKYCSLEQLSQLRAHTRQAIEKGQAQKCVIEVSLPSGRHAFFSTIMQPVKDASGLVTRLFGTVQDITEQKKIERERQVLLEQTLQISDLKSNLITQAAHELKTPLTAILGWGELFYNAKQRGRSIDAMFDLEDFETILRNAERLNALVDDFLDVGRLESGKLILHRREVDFTTLLENAIQAVNYLVIKKKVQILTQSASPMRIFVDPKRIEQVLINLLSNAVKYSPDNSRVTVTTALTETLCGKNLKVLVTDEGYGFTPEELAEAMTPFGKVYTQQEQKRAVQGTGLGLFISQRIIEQHDGALTIHSAGPNQGSQVEIFLPVVQMPYEIQTYNQKKEDLSADLR